MRSLCMLFCIVTGICVSVCNASDWKIYPMFVDGIKNMVNKGDRLYFLSGSSLYEYDKSSASFDILDRRDKLNDNVVSDLYFNSDRKWLVVCYESSNIDVIHADGTVVNVPGLMNMHITSSKKINDVTFNGSSAYIATDFGYAVYDDEKKAITQSAVWYKSVKSVAEIDGNLWFSMDDGLYHVPAGEHVTVASLVSSSLKNVNGRLREIGESSFFVVCDNALWRVDIAEEMSVTSSCLVNGQVTVPEREVDGGFVTTLHNGAETYIAMLDGEGNMSRMVQMPADMQNTIISTEDSDGLRWESGDKGIRKILVTNENNVVVESDYMRPKAVSMKIVGNLLMDDVSGKLYVMTAGPSNLTSEYGQPGYINVIDNDSIMDITPENVQDQENTGHLRDINSPIFDPNDASVVYFGTWYDGVYKLKDGEVVMKYDQHNSPMVLSSNWYCLVPAVQFDKGNNLWVMQTDINSNGYFYVLPREKTLENEVSASDWIIPRTTAINEIDSRMKFIITKRDNIKIFTNGLWNSYLRLLDDDGNPAGEIVEKKFERLRDKNGRDVLWNYIYCFYEDVYGNIWTGTDKGVFYFNPLEAFSDVFEVTQPMVNDGLLLVGEPVTCIVADARGRKWFGTEASGIYVTNESGTEILEHFDVSNSLLPDNKILAICPGVNGNIFVGTNYGLAEVVLDINASRDDYSKAAVCPDIVYPEHTSGVAIVNLKMDSHIVIVDADDEVVADIMAVGGSAVWNTCGLDGEFVPTGEYTVLVTGIGSVKSGYNYKIGSVKIIR